MWLVIMCALVLIRTGLGAVVADNTVSDNRLTADICLHECIQRCQQSVKARSSNCVTKCETSCATSSTPVSNRPLESDIPAQKTPLVGDLEDAVGRRPRTRRRHSRSPTWREAAVIARSVGLDLGPLDMSADDRNDASGAVEDGRQVVPRLVSLVSGEDSVTAVVSWDSPGLSSGSPWYMVTWETQGGGVRGNLLANSSSVSLTLQSGSIYHIQVSPAGSEAASAWLEVDTRSSLPLVQGATRASAPPRVEGLCGVAAAVVLFLVVFLSFKYRGKNSSKTIDQSPRHRRLFKLYPPPVTLVERPTSQLTA